MNTIRIIGITILLLLRSSSISANTSDDSTAIVQLLQEAKDLYGYTLQSDSLISRALEQAITLDHPSLIAYAYYRKAWYYSVNSDITQAQAYNDSALHFYQLGLDTSGIAICAGFEAILLMDYGSYHLAEEQFLKAKELYLSANDESGYLNIANNLGVLYNDNSQYEQGLHEHQLVLNHPLIQYDTTRLARAYYNSGASQLGLSRTAEAYESFRHSYLLRTSIDRKWGDCESLERLGFTGLQLIKEGHELAASIDDPLSQLKSALSIANQLNASGLKLRILESLEAYYLYNAQYEEAHHTQSEYLQLLNETKLDENNLAAYVSIESQLKSEIQKNQILNLENDNYRIEQEKRKQTQQRNLIGLMLLGACTGFFAIYRVLRNREKVKKLQLELQEKQLISQRQENEISVMNAIIEGTENERQRVATELHDGIGNLLTVLKLQVEQEATVDPKILNTLEDTHSEVRNIAHNMMPVSLSQLGLSKAVQELCKRYNTNSTALYSLFVNGDQYKGNKKHELMIYRILQEVFQNIEKHAKASEVNVVFENTSDGLNLSIEDNGQGWDQEKASQGIGLKNIKSRVDFLKGSITICSEPNNGTKVEVNIPSR